MKKPGALIVVELLIFLGVVLCFILFSTAADETNKIQERLKTECLRKGGSWKESADPPCTLP